MAGPVSLTKAKYTRKIKWGEPVPQTMSQLLESDSDFFGVMAQVLFFLAASKACQQLVKHVSSIAASKYQKLVKHVSS